MLKNSGILYKQCASQGYNNNNKGPIEKGFNAIYYVEL
jgi:hypothetical protein